MLYTGAAAVEREVRWDDQNHVLSSNEEEAWTAVEHIIKGHMKALETDRCFIALSGSQVFRRDIFPDYKAGRSRKPLCYMDLVDRLKASYQVKSYPQLEADDLMGIWQTSGKLGDTIIVSADKDMKTIPGKLYRGGVLQEISEHEADFYWMMQTLTGDVTDGYPGCPGVGEKKASAGLTGKLKELAEAMTPAEHVKAMWSAVLGIFTKAGLTEEDAILQARLARILRSCDWDSAKQEVKLWNP